MHDAFLKLLAKIQPGSGNYKAITEDSVLEALNPFHATSNIDDLFGFIALGIRLLLSFGGLIGVAFIIYGGYQYITSGGSPEATKKATTTLTWAIIGVIIAFSASLIVGFIIGNVTGTEGS